MIPKGVIIMNSALSDSRRHYLASLFRQALDEKHIDPRSLRFRFLLWVNGCRWEELAGGL